jgi:hypothetical protein
MAVTIWTTNKIPTVRATRLLLLGAVVVDIGGAVVLMVVMACPFRLRQERSETRF